MARKRRPVSEALRAESWKGKGEARGFRRAIVRVISISGGD